MERLHIFGVDFSGASDPRNDIWISEAEIQDGMLKVHSCKSARDVLGGIDRTEVLGSLRKFIAESPDSIFGLDFPFGLPATVSGTESWTDFIKNFQGKFGEYSATEFREECASMARNETNGSAAHLRRETDWRFGGQCPYNLQMQYQTYYGLLHVIAPLIEDSKARFLPMQSTDNELPWVVEAYPAATLGSLRLYRQGYKKNTEAQKQRRERNVEQFAAQNNIVVSDEVQKEAIQRDDALDSILAAYAAFRAQSEEFPEKKWAKIEGQIYA